jgi:uncharacterized membrane protein YhaH (DUF805 family)
MRMDWTELLLSSTGRLPRTAFLICAALLLAAAAIYQAAPGAALHRLTGWIVYSALLFSSACIASKRLHDRGRSGWWAFVVIAGLIGAWPAPRGVLGLACALILAGSFIELGLMPGERGANRFGPSPARARG